MRTGQRTRRTRLFVGLLAATTCVACDTGSDDEPTAVTSPPTSSDDTGATLDTSEPCLFLSDVVSSALTDWTSTDKILNAEITGSRLGTQPEDGIPATLVDGCVWEARGAAGGHIAIAVERFQAVDLDGVAALAEQGGFAATELADGRLRWDVPPQPGSPSGAVIVGDSEALVAVRVESHSDDPDRNFLAAADEGAGGFFDAVGDAIQTAD